MADSDKRISELDAADPLTVTDEVVVVQSGISKRGSGQQIVDLVESELPPPPSSGLGPIVYSVGDLVIQPGDPNSPAIIAFPGVTPVWRLAADNENIFGIFIVPPNVNPVQALNIRIGWSPSTALAGWR